MRALRRSFDPADAALSVLDHLAQTIAAETKEIAAGGPVAYETYSERKNQGFLELTRLLPSIECARSHEGLRGGLLDLIEKLEANRRALGFQLRAAVSVADIIARAIHEGQSDGTYTAAPWDRR